MVSEPQRRKHDDKPLELGFLRGIVIIVGIFLWLTAILSKVFALIAAVQ
jgi:hypothetical protein